jgi:predicted acylesterase/phospholipase RssA/MinD-like ATPase involved in chromosome partitioning or flagellar assembly
MIYTFYSFKGGVGRSMALANVAEAFYLAKLRVIMIDWDLEAPGLESYFFSSPKGQPDPKLSEIQSRPGLLELLCEHQEWTTRERSTPISDLTVEEDEEDLSPLRKKLREIRQKTQPQSTRLTLQDVLFPLHPPPPASPKEPGLWLIPAGRRGPQNFDEYARKVQDFDWNRFYDHHGGKAFFDDLRAQLIGLADVILIDSRTGVTEMGGVCSRQMADAVVAMAAPNFQNLDGVARIVRAFDNPRLEEVRGGRKLPVMVVPSRVDEGPEKLRFEEYEKLFQAVIENQVAIPASLAKQKPPFFSLRIPYLPYYSYEEERVIGPGLKENTGAAKLIEAYQKLTARLASLAPQDSRVRAHLLNEIRKELPDLVVRPTVLLAYAENYSQAEVSQAARFLSEAGFQLLPNMEYKNDSDTWKERIDSAGAVIFFLNTESEKDSHLRHEAIYARRAGKLVLTVSTENCRVPLWSNYSPSVASTDLALLPQKIDALPPPVKLPFLAPPTTPVTQVERADLENKIRSQIASYSGAFGIGGPAGSGKTWLASRIASSSISAEMFPGGIFWLTPDLAHLEESMSQVLAALEGPETAHRAKGDLKKTLAARLQSARCLLVLDELAEPSVLTTFVELAPNSVCLFTARNRDFLSPSSSVEVPPLSITECASLMGNWGLHPSEVLLQALKGSPLVVMAVAEGLSRMEPASRDQIAQELAQTIPSDGIGAFAPAGLGQVANIIVSAAQKMLSPLKASVRNQVHDPADQEAREALRRYFLIDESGALTPVVRMYLGLRQSIPRRDPNLSTSEAREKSKDVGRARELLNATADLATIKDLAGTLRRRQYWDLAGALYAKALQHPDAGVERELFAQRLAHATYNDLDVAAEKRFDCALKILRDHCRLEQIFREGCTSLPTDPTVRNREIATRQETLGLAGAIYKRRWIYDNRIENLEHSAAYYQAGASLGVAAGDGYTAINTVFALDLLAATLERDTEPSAQRKERLADLKKEVRRLRDELIEELGRIAQQPLPPSRKPKDLAWLYASLGEAYFGRALDQPSEYDFALLWLREAARWMDGWQYQTLAHQLARLANLAEDRGGGELALRALKSFLNENSVITENLRRGKVGLALSGGGFRASLFHIGVLARLAELDILRHIEVLSCVSGGSIIGAQYYLELQTLLQEKPDAEISQADYVEIVKRVEVQFVQGVERNLRVRVASNPFKNFWSAVSPKYSRSARLGELYESELFSRANGWKNRDKFYMDDLLVKPKGDEEFNPKYDNWRRQSKVPILLLNAATVNTGHNWQFAANWMGEPPYLIDEDIDATQQFKRIYYWQAPQDYRRVRLGVAVGASSCVPALFEPIRLPGLYEGRNVQLVDGGVHDNQGTAGLLEQECSFVIVSDASGQMDGVNDATFGMLDALSRARNILESRVRGSQFRSLMERKRSGLLRQLAFLHLKRDLHAEDSESGATTYGVSKKTQGLLAAVRTDLDAFHEQESCALMVSGYRMASSELESMAGALLPARSATSTRGQPAQKWRFLDAESLVNGSAATDDVHALRKNLEVAASVPGKLWKLAPFPMAALAALWLAAFVLLPRNPTVKDLLDRAAARVPDTISNHWTWIWIPIGILFLAALWKGILWLLGKGWKSFSQIVVGMCLAIVGWVVAQWYLLFLNPLYLALGRLPNSPRPTAALRWGSLLLLQLLPAVFVARELQQWRLNRASLTELAAARSAYEQLCSNRPACPDENLRKVTRAWTEVLDRKPEPSDNVIQEALRSRSLSYRRTEDWALALSDLGRLTNPTLADQMDTAYCMQNLGAILNSSGFLQAAINIYSDVLAAPTAPPNFKLEALRGRFFLRWEIYAKLRADLTADPKELQSLRQKLKDDGTELAKEPLSGDESAGVTQRVAILNADESPRIVTVQVADKSQVGLAQSLFGGLLKNGFNPGNHVDVSDRGPNSFVKYFNYQDRGLADALIGLVRTQLLIDLGRPVMGDAKQPAGTLNLYFAASAKVPGAQTTGMQTLLVVAATENQRQLLMLLGRPSFEKDTHWIINSATSSAVAVPPPAIELRYTFDGSAEDAGKIKSSLEAAGFPKIKLANLNQTAPGRFEVRPGSFELWLALDTQVPSPTRLNQPQPAAAK